MNDIEIKKAQKKHKRIQRRWRVLQALSRLLIYPLFNLVNEQVDVEGPIILISNHVTSWDPFIVAMSLNHKQVYYVAGEHLFRMGIVSKLIRFLFDPISRRKGTVGRDTVKLCLTHIREGHSICIFAEGGLCWDGISQSIVPSTGKLIRTAGATLVTYRLEGAYLALPRWRRNITRGKIYGHPVNVYTPDRLHQMTPEQINESIEHDIYENCWERQKSDPVIYKQHRRAEGLERMLYMCPECGKIGGLATKDNSITCSCGMTNSLSSTGFFEKTEHFSNISEWDRWERERLSKLDFPHEDYLFADEDLILTKVDADHNEISAGRGRLIQYEDKLEICGKVFPENELTHMAMAFTNRLFFSCKKEYYQIRTDKGTNLRKYYEYWKVI